MENTFSSKLTQPKAHAVAQAMLYATGFSEEDMKKGQVGIASVWYEGNPCNMHLLELSEYIKQGVESAGLKGLRFNTIGVSDGISMGTEGMSYSLPSRDLIADSIETVMEAHFYDACIATGGCDKNMPGCMIGIERVNRPAIFVYGGSMHLGCFEGKPIDNTDAARTFFGTTNIPEDIRKEIIRHACPGAGSCNGMFTANTMACAIEAMGMSLPYSSSCPAVDQEKRIECVEAGKAIRLLLEKNIKPSEIMTAQAFKDAIVLVMVLGGSTNAVLHLLAMAKAVNVNLSIEDFEKIAAKTPVLGEFKPSGKHAITELHAVGGTPAVLKLLLRHKMIDGSRITVTGKTLAENLEKLPDLTPGQTIIRPIEDPLKATGHLRILKGNVAPDGSVAKITGKEGTSFSGPARVFDSEEKMLEAMHKNEISKGSVVVIRYEGPKGGPGMPEMLYPTFSIVSKGLGKDIALITDGRFSGASSGFIIGHVCPEAQEGGPIAQLKDGDIITIDAVKNTINVDVTDKEMAARKSKWKMPPYKSQKGTLARFIRTVSSASTGCVTDSFEGSDEK